MVPCGEGKAHSERRLSVASSVNDYLGQSQPCFLRHDLHTQRPHFGLQRFGSFDGAVSFAD
jgi:hypothetical protein